MGSRAVGRVAPQGRHPGGAYSSFSSEVRDMASTAQSPTGQPIRMGAAKLQAPDNPILPFIEGDGTGPDIWRAAQRVFDAAVEKADGGQRRGGRGGGPARGW